MCPKHFSCHSLVISNVFVVSILLKTSSFVRYYIYGILNRIINWLLQIFLFFLLTWQNCPAFYCQIGVDTSHSNLTLFSSLLTLFFNPWVHYSVSGKKSFIIAMYLQILVIPVPWLLIALLGSLNFSTFLFFSINNSSCGVSFANPHAFYFTMISPFF